MYGVKRNCEVLASSNSPPRPRHSRKVYSTTGDDTIDRTEEPPRKFLRTDRDVRVLVFPPTAGRNVGK